MTKDLLETAGNSLSLFKNMTQNVEVIDTSLVVYLGAISCQSDSVGVLKLKSFKV